MEANIGFLTRYVPKNELAALIKNAHGKEGGFFKELLLDMEKKSKELAQLKKLDGRRILILSEVDWYGMSAPAIYVDEKTETNRNAA